MRGTSRSNFICENATPPSSKTFPDKWKSVQVILFAVRAVVPPKQQLQFWSTFNIMSKWHLENAALWITFSTNMHHQFHRFNAWVSFNYYGCSQLNCAHMRWSLGKSATSGSDCLTSQHMHMLAMRLLVLLCVFQQFALAFSWLLSLKAFKNCPKLWQNRTSGPIWTQLQATFEGWGATKRLPLFLNLVPFLVLVEETLALTIY